MGDKGKNQRKRRMILLAVAVCVVLLGGTAGYIALSYQKEAVVMDDTSSAGRGNANGSVNSNTEEYAGGKGKQEEAVLSPNVQMFVESDAKTVNEAIRTINVTNQGVLMEVEKGTGLDELGEGDIFLLEGSEETPFGQTYIGKIASKKSGEDSVRYLIEAPMMDEVFDVLNIDYTQVLSIDSISEIQTVEGVTVSFVNDVSSYFTEIPDSYALDGNTATVLSQRRESSGGFTTLADVSLGDGLLFEYELDLLELLKQEEDDASEKFKEKYEATEGSRVEVYKTQTGNRYHRENCVCLSRSKQKITLAQAAADELKACRLCYPPVFEEDTDLIEAGIKLEGKIGIEDFVFGVDFDWDILNGGGLENLALSASGNYLAEAKLTANVELEFGGEDTVITLAEQNIKLEGLSEKLIPIAFIGYNGSFTPAVTGNAEIRALTGPVPLTIGVILYVDINGNVTVGMSGYLNYSQEFHYAQTIVKDGLWVMQSEKDVEEPKFNIGLEAEASIDADAHLGASLNLYVFNLNVIELAVAKIGVGVEGEMKLDYSMENNFDMAEGFSASYYARLYYKIMELNIKLKSRLKIWDAAEWSNTLEFTSTLLDRTIKEWGKKSPTHYSSSAMEYTVVTAKDDTAVYYKGTNGALMKEVDNYKTPIYEEDFFVICGIDDSFLYVLKKNDSGLFDIYRIAKDGSVNKKLVENITNCLTMDETYLYYTEEFDETVIRRINRETLEESKYADFDYEVTYMKQLGDEYYVVAKEDSIFSMFFGTPTYYYLLDANGDIISDYGTNLTLENYFMKKFDNYYEASKMASGGFLRNSAYEIRWVSKDKTRNVLTSGVSGWNAKEAGIFTTQNYYGGTEPYQIVLYLAENGEMTEVTEVSSKYAFFTLCQSRLGDWYFFDQTTEGLILYVLEEDFSSKSVIKTFSFDEIACNLSECSMVIMDNRLYFYMIQDDSVLNVLYRYDLE